jgi:hypothetical protein
MGLGFRLEPPAVDRPFAHDPCSSPTQMVGNVSYLWLRSSAIGLSACAGWIGVVGPWRAVPSASLLCVWLTGVGAALIVAVLLRAGL